jgi:hypothetical protein
MTVQDAIKQVAQLDPYRTHNIHLGTHVMSPSGKVTIDYEIQRGVKPCPVCGQNTGMGRIVVQHSDGRSVAFDPALYHYVDAGHVISGVDGDTLVAIMCDA